MSPSHRQYIPVVRHYGIAAKLRNVLRRIDHIYSAACCICRFRYICEGRKIIFHDGCYPAQEDVSRFTCSRRTHCVRGRCSFWCDRSPSHPLCSPGCILCEIRSRHTTADTISQDRYRQPKILVPGSAKSGMRQRRSVMHDFWHI